MVMDSESKIKEMISAIKTLQAVQTIKYIKESTFVNDGFSILFDPGFCSIESIFYKNPIFQNINSLITLLIR